MTRDGDLFSRLDAVIDGVGCNTNRFYERFIAEQLRPPQLQFFADQYFYYIRTFPQILAGLSHRVDSEETRYQLARTVVSELGEGRPGKMHFQLFQRSMRPLGVDVSAWERTEHIPEAEALVTGIRALYLEGPPIAALGGHYTIEKTGLPMLNSLYEGLRKYPGPTVEDLGYFHLHLVLEADHVDWIRVALEPYGAHPEHRRTIEGGTRRIAELLAGFWNGLVARLFPAGAATPAAR